MMSGALQIVRIFARAARNGLVAARSTLSRELGMFAKAKVLRRSRYFDPGWYLKNNISVAEAGQDPAWHYIAHGVSHNRNPSRFFTTDEYLALNYDVRESGMNPLLHYELHGRREGRPISFLDLSEPKFPSGCECGTWRFGRRHRAYGRTAVVASYFSGGKIPARLLFFLRGLGEVVDNIVLVADCPVFPQEVEKLRDMVSLAVFERHHQYDFGSYRIGLGLCRAEGLLDKTAVDELVLTNDSSYGPVYPFAESFQQMAGRHCDFWGYTGYNAFGNVHISSYFYTFRRKVVDSGCIDEFLSGVRGSFDRGRVVVLFELRFTRYLADRGFKWDTFVPMRFGAKSPTKYPFAICSRYRMPLVKVKSVDGDSFENVEKVLRLVRRANPELSCLIEVNSLKAEHRMISVEEHQASFPGKCARIAEKIKAGKRVSAVFFVSDAAMFPAKPLFDAMLGDQSFSPKVVVIPDLRWSEWDFSTGMEVCRNKLLSEIPGDCVHVAPQDDFGLWKDVLEDVDIVCYPSPYDLSSFRYNPRYAVGRNFLPICVNYGFYRSVYDRRVMQRENYSYMWKAFFECEDTISEYRRNSEVGGANADVVGYVKMDGLASVIPKPHARKRILVALHHSVEGGTNKMLSLANFVRYADFFLRLPDQNPDIDFVFRPHPFLIKVMSRNNQWGEQRTSEYFNELRAKPNVIWSDGGDYFREFAESDACIQDCGSYLVEYFYTKKPCCYMLKSPGDIEAKFAPLGRKCLAECYLAYDTAAIDSFIRDVVISGSDPKRAGRENFAETVMVNYPRAAEVALAHIKEDLDAGA